MPIQEQTMIDAIMHTRGQVDFLWQFFVTVQLHEGERMEQCFVRVKKIDGTKISATVASEILSLKKVRNGDPVTLEESEIIDWLIAKPDGSEEGNVVGKFLDTYQP